MLIPVQDVERGTNDILIPIFTKDITSIVMSYTFLPPLTPIELSTIKLKFKRTIFTIPMIVREQYRCRMLSRVKDTQLRQDLHRHPRMDELIDSSIDTRSPDKVIKDVVACHHRDTFFDKIMIFILILHLIAIFFPPGYLIYTLIAKESVDIPFLCFQIYFCIFSCCTISKDYSGARRYFVEHATFVDRFYST